MDLETPSEILAHEASPDAVGSFLKWRKATKKPLTERAAALICQTLREITMKGGNADEALDLAQEHGWQTIKAHWYWRIKNDTSRNYSKPDATLDAIAIAARSRRTPGQDRF